MKLSSWPKYQNKEIISAIKILKSGKVNYWTGKQNKNFEKQFQKYFNLKHAVTVANGTAALYLAVKVLNLKKNSEILVTPRSYFASASCILMNDCKPKFTDIDLATQNICVKTLEKNISNKTKAIICVHLNGYPCDMKEIMKIAKKNNIFVIEDCSQAHGAMIGNKHVGSFGDIGVWSFCQDKIISTGGEGGMISTKKTSFYKKIWSMKDQGRNIDKVGKFKNGKFQYLHDYLGLNLRMTEVQAKLGSIQLSNLKKTIKKRNFNANLIIDFLKKYSDVFHIFKIKKNYKHAFYRLCLTLKISKKKINNLFNKCSEKKIEIFSGPCPEIYKEKIFKKFLGKKFFLKNANYLSGRTISFLVDQTISEKKMKTFLKKLGFIINQIK